MAPQIFLALFIAQTHASAPRLDGHETPLTVYAVKSSSGCAPLALISHGAGGSENGYAYLAQALADNGFTAIVMGHRESGLAALRSDIQGSGIGPGVRELVENTSAETARLLDVTAALKFAEASCKPPFRVLLGHSMGAITVMMEAGARNIIHVAAPPAAQDRFDAYVALSPEGPGIAFSEHAWNGIRKPMLILTGTRDQSLKGGPQARQIPFRDLPGIASECQWMGAIDGATHMNFGGRGPGADRVKPMVTTTVTNFLKGVRGPGCLLPPATAGMTLQAK
ncbi:MAG TPA: alpha/beta fold hydrolase [Bryobacteraceae bacterium]|nr:alpha/beta fold hydrolase [Bryobacteraceae bacterium]